MYIYVYIYIFDFNQFDISMHYPDDVTLRGNTSDLTEGTGRYYCIKP